MQKIKNNSTIRVVLYGLDLGIEKSTVIPGARTTIVPDFFITTSSAPSPYTETLTANGMQKIFSITEDIDQVAGVVVKVNGVTQSGNYTISERPGVITFSSYPAEAASVAITYTNWDNARYQTGNIITVTTV